MPDIAMCSNTKCPLKEKCYRFKARPDEHWQSYRKFEPRIIEDTKEIVCDYFWKM